MKQTSSIHRNFAKKSKLQEIIGEYSLKKNLMNPNKPSPNKFLKKLEYRMKYYYNDMYNSFKVIKK